MHCTNCGVELEDDMLSCPLCRQPLSKAQTGKVSNDAQVANVASSFTPAKMSAPEKRFTWEIISIIMLSAAIASFIVDFLVSRRISWSEYPVAICFTIFFYVSLFAFWDQKTIVKMLCGFLVSSIFIIVLDALTGGIEWSHKLGVPLFFVANLIVAILISIFVRASNKGINLIAYAFIGAAIFCICAESILSYYETGEIEIDWSIIVAACIIPVVIVLLFVHFRLKKGQSLKKTFHV